MSSQEAQKSVDKEIQVPAWEHETTSTQTGHAGPRKPLRSILVSKLDTALPPHRRYVGLSRKVFLLVLVGVSLALLALIIGLAVGLSDKSSHGKNLPLPSNAQTAVGDLTYYEAGLGACGETNGQSDHIVSISHFVFDAAGSSSSTGGNSNANPLCNRMLRASRYDEEYGAQRSIDLKVVDRCTGCEPDDLDTTLGAFEKLAPSASGRVDVTWAWLQPTGK